MDLDAERERLVNPYPKSTALATIVTVVATILGLGVCATIGVAALSGSDFTTMRSVVLNSVWPSAWHDFSKVYAALAIPEIPPADFDSDVYEGLLALEQEPCNRTAIMSVGRALVKKKDPLRAGAVYEGFTKACHENEYTEREAAHLYYGLGAFEKAKVLYGDLVFRFPQNDNDWYNKGLSEAALGLSEAALESYATTIALSRNPAAIREKVFYDMAALYAASGRFCEAMAPLEAYVAIMPQKRDTPRSNQMIASYSYRGRCATFSSGSDKFPVFGNGVIRVRASINNVVGTFVIDTGASFVSITEQFASKTHINSEAAPVKDAVTANGNVSVKLAKAATIRMGGVQANDVPVVILGKPLGQLDGLLGRSFLSRFDMTITHESLSLRSKT